jgi:hypothetical protein
VSEDAVAKYVAAIRAEIEPDPLFKRRLRGQVVNRFVAIREGSEPRVRGGRQMGSLGRAVLYASFAFAVSVTGVMAAAQEAMPGDALYPLKRQIERLRHDVLPAHLQDDLVAIELTERLEELGYLTRSGETARAEALMVAIKADYVALAALGPGAGVLESRNVVLDALVERLPEPARAAVEAVIAEVGAGHAHGGVTGGGSGSNAAGAPTGGEPGAAPSAPEGDGQAPATPAGRDVSPKPDPTAEPTPKPTRSPKPSG